MKEISKLILELSSVCRIYSIVISGRGITCKDVLTVVTFINSFPSVHDVDLGIRDLVLKESAERLEIILKKKGREDGSIIFKLESKSLSHLCEAEKHQSGKMKYSTDILE